MTYYNTTGLKGQELIRENQKALTQEQRILNFFQRTHNAHTPSGVWRWVFHQEVPITSVRRAMTTLEKQGKLVKTSDQRVGIYGKPEHFWRLPARSPQQLELNDLNSTLRSIARHEI